MRHEDDILDKTKESFLKAPEKPHTKHNTRSCFHDPNLDHAAGDYEPIQEDSRFHASDQERTAGKSNKERRFMQKKIEQQHCSEKVGDSRSIIAALDHDRQ
ncbi:hypothetical protein FQ087_11620 [Sporosarcina sp. ANT_H38]|uniref:hypothetical protein n=1 Tax=Sporosarcina sp. ANT_H38 TaxID=2597358 RepID=UPI0011F344C0|nr:hypothetical protein [Sporosarcina sp. ANT_H38]KAA0966835.1 hypothetical protein FQ087_11620 [Sporosarcina sp. ANT_H38]